MSLIGLAADERGPAPISVAFATRPCADGPDLMTEVDQPMGEIPVSNVDGKDS